MRVVAVAALLSVALLADVALASRSGIAAYRYTGRPGDGTTRTCTYCHNASSVAPPSVAVTGLDGLVAGGSTTLTLTITSSHASPSGRIAGFAVATDGAGVFSNTSGDGITNHCRIGNVIKHEAPPSLSTRCDGTVPCPSFFDESGSVSYSLVLENLQAGAFTLYAGVNDANDDSRSAGDRATVVALPFTVAAGEGAPGSVSCDGPGEGEGEGEDPGEGEGEASDAGPRDDDDTAPGCGSVSGSTRVDGAALALVAWVLAARRRRRTLPPIR